MAIFLAVAGAFACGGGLGFLWGRLVENSRTYERRFQDEAADLRSVLARHAPKYSNLAIDRTSTGGAYLTGTIASEDDRAALQTEMAKVFGEERGKSATSALDLAPSPETSRPARGAARER